MNRVIKLKKQATVHIEPTSPFNFQGTFIKPSHFPSRLVVCDKGEIFQSMEVGRNVFGLKIFNLGYATPKVGIAIYAKKPVSKVVKEVIKSEITFRYNLDGNVQDFVDEFKNDSLLAGPIKKWGGMRPSSAYSLYGYLMVATVLQNATVKRTVQMMNALLEKYGKRLVFAGKEIYAIWDPADIKMAPGAELIDLKVGYRAKNLKRISDLFFNKPNLEHDFRVITDRQTLKKSLLEIYGVGPQSASYLLFGVFHFYDALDHLSPWEGKIISMLLYGNKTADLKHMLEDIEKRWGKWKMLAVHYIFEDLFWRREKEKIPWLEEEIRM